MKTAKPFTLRTWSTPLTIGSFILMTAHNAQADQAQAWFRLYRSLGGGWNADPSPTDQRVAQP